MYAILCTCRQRSAIIEGCVCTVLTHKLPYNNAKGIAPQPRPDQTGSTRCVDHGEVKNNVKLLDVGATAAAGRHHTNRPVAFVSGKNVSNTTSTQMV